MPKIKPLTQKGKYDKQTEEYREIIFGRIGALRMTQESLAKCIGKSRSALSYTLKDIDRLKFRELRIIADQLGLEVILRKKGDNGNI